MAQVRQIQLINDVGERRNLLLRSNFFNDISGLGFGQEQNYISQGSSFYKLTRNETEQSVIEGALSFIDRKTAYSDYRDFNQWISHTDTLTMAYKPYGNEEYLKDVAVVSLSKGEMDIGGFLSCNITFRGLSAWYSTENLSFTFSSSALSNNEKRYSYRYSYRYGVSRVPGSVEFIIDGDYDGAIYMQIEAPASSPVLNLYQGSTRIGSLSFSGVSVTTGQTLIYSTIPNNTGVWILENGELTSILDSVQMLQGVPSFFKLPRNKSLRLSLVVQGGTIPNASIQIHRYWRTV